MLYAFSRMTETANVYENKNICLKIAEVLLHFGADINYYHHGKTLLMTFCGISMTLDPVQLEMNLDVIRFLCEHGADKTLRSRSPSTVEGLTAYDMATYHCSSAHVKQILTNTKQIFFHPKLEKKTGGSSGVPNARREANIVLDDSNVKVGCCSLFYFGNASGTVMSSNKHS